MEENKKLHIVAVNSKTINSIRCTDLHVWLQQNGVSPSAASKLWEAEIDGRAFMLLKDLHLIELGIALGPRLVILDLVKKLNYEEI
jgi:hypothetical protein